VRGLLVQRRAELVREGAGRAPPSHLLSQGFQANDLVAGSLREGRELLHGGDGGALVAGVHQVVADAGGSEQDSSRLFSPEFDAAGEVFVRRAVTL
jgi:hypothetical protein